MMQARFLVSGVVQGVFFRAHTRRRAIELGLTGHAINLPDGRVEVLACGEARKIDLLQQWLREGSPRSAVSDVLRLEADEPVIPAQFTTG